MSRGKQKNIAIYIHYPFCESKCPYCDFNSHVEDSIDSELYKKAYLREIDYYADLIDEKNIDTIFFGGGTPSLMKEDLLEDILDHLAKKFTINQDVEITLEANPGSFEVEKFNNFKKIGINRLSIGIQSFDDKALKFLGRKHDANQAIKAIENAKKIFDNFSFDLIYALPNQNLKDWLDQLKYALSFQTKHLSLYQLTIEKGTKFFSDFSKGKFKMLSDELSADFFDETVDLMQENNYKNYEISNFAKKGFECKHNLNYWQGVDYVGLGAGAHGRIHLKNNDLRSSTVNFHTPTKWLNEVLTKGNALQKIEEISKIESMEEIILTGLRLENGIKDKLLMKNFDLEKLKKLQELELIVFSEDFVKINPKKKILTNEIIFKVCQCYQ